jgi:hypothetical protein
VLQYVFHISVSLGFFEDFLRCFSMKVGLERKVFQYLFMHLSCTIFFTGRKPKTVVKIGPIHNNKQHISLSNLIDIIENKLK